MLESIKPIKKSLLVNLTKEIKNRKNIVKK